MEQPARKESTTDLQYLKIYEFEDNHLTNGLGNTKSAQDPTNMGVQVSHAIPLWKIKGDF